MVFLRSKRNRSWFLETNGNHRNVFFENIARKLEAFLFKQLKTDVFLTRFPIRKPPKEPTRRPQEHKGL